MSHKTFKVIQLPHDNEGVREWLHRYKAFRLYALNTDPQAFGSTYAKEAAWKDEEWYTRLSNPEAVTFVALQEGVVVGTLTSVLLSCGPEEMILPGTTWEGPAVVRQGPIPLHYRIFGMYTAPESRGQGIAKALLAAAVKQGQEHADSLGRPFVGTLATASVNEGAQALYRKCGFQPIRNLTYVFENVEMIIVILQYTP